MNHHVDTPSSGRSCADTTSLNRIDHSSPALLAAFVERRDQYAFSELVRLHGPLVYGVCRRVVGSHHDAQDAFQATFLVLSQKAASIKHRELLCSWLYRVAYQVSLRAKAMLHRQRARERSMEDIQAIPASQPSVWAELAPILDDELSRLSDKYRLPLLLCDLEGSTQKQAASELGLPEGTVSTRLIKARELLARQLNRRGLTLSAGTLAVLLAENTASASLPEAWIATTLHTTNSLTTGGMTAQSLSTSKIATLAQEAMKPMLFVNLKVVAAIAIFAALGLAFLPQQADHAAAAEITLPPEIQQDLEEGARQLNPITISYTKQLKSSLSEPETMERLALTTDRNRDFYFAEVVHRVIWQDKRFYTSTKFPVVAPLPAESRSRRGFQINQTAFDGRILYEGQVLEQGNEGVFAKDTEASYSKRRPNRTVRDAFASPYFADFSGWKFPPGKERVIALRAESTVLGALREGGQLVSVETTMLDERPHVKVTLTIENAAKTLADKMDLAAVRKSSAQRREPSEQTQLAVDRIMLARKLPATKRVVCYLDPERHHALRRSEEWYEPDHLLARCDCSDFEQIADRPLWLPRRCEVDHRTFRTAPGIVLEGEFLKEVLQVTELTVTSASDQQFVLNYTNPGILIYDETGSDPNATSTPAASNAAPYLTGGTPEETSRNKAAAQQQAHADQVQAEVNQSPPKAVQTPLGGWLLIGNIAMVLVIAIVIGYRKFVRI